MEATPSSGLIPLLVGLVFLLVFGGVVALVVYAGWRGKQEKLALSGRKARARPGRARVVQASSKQISGGHIVITDMYLTLSVETPSGRFQAKAGWTVLQFTSADSSRRIATDVADALGLAAPAQGDDLTYHEWKRRRDGQP